MKKVLALIIAGMVMVAFSSTPADAARKKTGYSKSYVKKHYKKYKKRIPHERKKTICNPLMGPPCWFTSNVNEPSMYQVYPQTNGKAVENERPVSAYGAPTPGQWRGYHTQAGNRSSSGLVAPLAAKVAEIQSACGSKLISGVRHTYIRGTRRISLHASGKAADMQGNPSCIYQHLSGWPGGYSTDYGRVRHVHISYDEAGGREWGYRFAHGGGHKHRYAKRTRLRYAPR